jgi:hypothetical protein
MRILLSVAERRRKVTHYTVLNDCTHSTGICVHFRLQSVPLHLNVLQHPIHRTDVFRSLI